MIENQLKIMRRKLELLPLGNLHCKRSNNVNQYAINGSYVSKKNIEYIKEIATRGYYEKIIPLCEKRLRLLKQIQREYSEDKIVKCYENLCRGRKELVEPIYESIDSKIKKFINQETDESKFDENDTTQFYTTSGIRMRSKSELLIARELDRYNVPYLYELPIELDDLGRKITLRPDFTIMKRSNGEIKYLEHLGMMDNMAYVGSNNRKLELYERNGLLIGRDIIITHETAQMPLSIKTLDQYIEEFLL